MIGEKDYLTADIHKTEWTSVLIENTSENKKVRKLKTMGGLQSPSNVV